MTLGTLYSNGHLCPFTHRVLIAAAELEAPIDVVYGDDIPAAVRGQVATGGWPVFITSDDGEMVRDSSEIVDYLIDHSGSQGEAYRSDPETLAKLDTLIDSIRKVIMAGIPSIQREYREKLDRGLAEVEAIRAATPGPFLEGDHFSQADGHIAPFLHRLPFLVEIRDHVPAIILTNDGLNAWIDRVVHRRSFQRIAPKRNALRQFYAANAKYGKPMKVGRLHHSGFRGIWNDLAARALHAAAPVDRIEIPSAPASG